MLRSLLWGLVPPAVLWAFVHTAAWAQGVPADTLTSAAPDTLAAAVLDTLARPGAAHGYVLLWGIVDVRHLALGAFGGLLWLLRRPARRGRPRYEPSVILRILLYGGTLGNFATLFLPVLVPGLRTLSDAGSAAPGRVEGLFAILAGFVAEPVLRWVATSANRRASGDRGPVADEDYDS